MEILSCVDLEARLVTLVCDAISYSSTKHHDRALHVIVHNIFKCWLKCLLVDQEEVNLLVSNHLDSDVSSYEVDLTSHVIKLFVLCPEASLFINFEEEN